MDEILRIWIPVAVTLFLTLYLYESGMRRLYDTVISAAAIIVLCPVIIAFCAAGRIKCGRAFERDGDELVFSCAKGRIKRLPRLLLVFVGKRNLLPKRLKDINF